MAKQPNAENTMRIQKTVYSVDIVKLTKKDFFLTEHAHIY